MKLSDLKHLQCPDLFQSLDPMAEELKKINEPKFWTDIPLVNYTPLYLLKDLQLVRFRGMIQDMQDPEFYLEKYEVRNTQDNSKRTQNGKYRDCLHLQTDEELIRDSDVNVQGERRTIFLVAVPGINTWALQYEEESNRLNVSNINTESESLSHSNAKKRIAPLDNNNMEVDDDTCSEEVANKNDNQTEILSKRLCRENIYNESNTEVTYSSVLAPRYLLNSPIPQRPSKACMVKIYRDFETYSLNSVIDVIGFLSVDPSLDGSNIDAEMYNLDHDNLNEMYALHPPPSLIPRLHAVTIHILPHHNPLLDERFFSQNSLVDADSLNMVAIQKDLITLLKLCFFNDELAADYVLSHLISTIYCRSEFESIGRFSLNVCNLPRNLPKDYSKKLYEILELLLPSSHYLPMNLNTLNTENFTPKKDYATNKLVSGLLQLAPQTHLLLDETCMEQGKLESSGVIAIQNLAHLINHQQIKCNFEYYEIDYNVDIPVFVLSEGRSMLPNDFTLPLQCDVEPLELMEETLKAARHFLQPVRLDRFRRYLTMGKITTFVMNSNDSEIVQDDFVEMRKNGSIKTADELHALLVLSRLLGIARGKTTFDKDSWELAKELEAKRRERIQALPKSKIINRT